jgi:hypothetical protein
MSGISGKYIYLTNEDSNLSPVAQDKILAKKVWGLSMDYLKDFTEDLDV